MVAGIVFADFLFIIAAVIGLATIAELLGPLFVVVQSIAGVYLIYIGVVQFRREALTAEPSTEATSSGSSSFLSGFVLTFGDPKAIFGYASLLPAFVDLTAVSIFDTIAIMAIAATAISVAKSFYLALGRHSVSWLANQALNSKLNAVAGSAFICAGLVVISRVCITTWL